MRGERILIPLKTGHHQPASETPFNLLPGRLWPNIECWLCRFVIFYGILTTIAKEPYRFVIFQGGPDSLSFLLSGSGHDKNGYP